MVRVKGRKRGGERRGGRGEGGAGELDRSRAIEGWGGGGGCERGGRRLVLVEGCSPSRAARGYEGVAGAGQR